MSAAQSWRPTASLAVLRERARLLAAVRAFFGERGLLEVETPVLVRHAVTDRHLHCARVELPGEPGPLYLHSSPEYAMKRLLAAGSGDIYQIARVVRGAERGRWHNAEFTLIEWYRCGWPMQRLMGEVAQLAAALLGPAAAAVESLSYREAFAGALGTDPFTAPEPALRALAGAHGLEAAVARGCDREQLLDWLMGGVVGPRLGGRGLCFLHHYPATQAALARLDPAAPGQALRFELYFRGIELANGFEELCDAAEQRARFERDREQRRRDGQPVPAADEALLAALEAGLPPAAGVALGFDRVLMLRQGAGSIDEVLAFPIDRA
jgi:lysyl-tRNA synthetase class 2